MVTNYEAIGIIKCFVHMAHTQFAATMKILRCDNARKLITSNTALEFFTSTGILHQTSYVQTPQQMV